MAFVCGHLTKMAVTPLYGKIKEEKQNMFK